MTLITTRKGPITADDLLCYAIDQQEGQVDALVVACARSKIAETMLSLIKRRGLLDSLLVELGLCALCEERQVARRVKK